MNPTFLTLDEVLALHEEQITRYGGRRGVRDLGLLISALGTPPVTFDGAFLHNDLFEMAAAYLYHVARNHPFVDGNKRTALAAALVFLWLNGFRLHADQNALTDLVVRVATDEATKAEAAVFLKAHSKPRLSPASE
jgi:death on curing protein